MFINQSLFLFGALVGRVANRIAGGRFTISDNTLHGCRSLVRRRA